MHLIVIGNPGVGKSSILNALISSNIFTSGISLGRGLTEYHKTVEYNHDLYTDTVGLYDEKLMHHALQDLEKLFSNGGDYTICFIITLESGRIKPRDIEMINMVSQTLEINNKYSLIINKIEPEIMENMEVISNIDEFETIIYKCLSLESEILYVKLYKSISELKGREIYKFLIKAPIVHVAKNPSRVFTTKESEIQKLRDNISTEKKINKRLLETVSEQEKRMKFCEVNGCNKYKEVGCMSCYNHKCNECNGTRLNAGTSNEAHCCRTHKCNISECIKEKTYGKYCDDHVCQWWDPQCLNRPTYDSKYCSSHKCRYDECVNNVQDIKSRYCNDHTCNSSYCSKVKSNKGSNYCSTHTCVETCCIEEIEDNSRYCSSHKCNDIGCKSGICSKSTYYCSKHACSCSNCGEQRYDESSYCMNHKCGTCSKKATYYGGYCKEHT